MHKDTFCLFHGSIYEVEYLGSYSITMLVIIEKHLVLLVKPVKLQIHDADGLPVIRHLPTSAINYMSDFICHYEFEILRSEFITNEQPVLNFDGPYHIVWECTHHHLFLHHLLLLKHRLHLGRVLWMTVLLLLRVSH